MEGVDNGGERVELPRFTIPSYIVSCGTSHQLSPPGIQLLRMYIDPAEDECFYSLSWSHDKDIPVIAVAGKRAVIRIIYPTNPGYNSDELVRLCSICMPNICTISFIDWVAVQ